MKRIILLISIICFCVSVSKAQWLNQNAGFTHKTLGFYEFSIVNQDVVWAICYDGVGGLFGPAHVLDFTRTTDGGVTWTAGMMGTDTSLAFSNICAISDSEAWVSMHRFNFSGGGGLFHTTDRGLTWSHSNPGVVFDSTSFPNFVYFKDNLNGVSGGDASGGYFEIYTTSDGGNTWTRTPQANIPASLPGGQYGWFDGYDVVGNTIWFGTYLGQMYKSTDFGLTWSVSTVDPAGNMVYEIAFADDGQHGLTHVRSNNATMLFSTSDGGTTWTQLPTHPKWKQSRITSVPGTNTFVSTSTTSFNFGSAYTNDFGVTWIELEALNQKAACRFLNATTGWVGGYFNDIPFPISGGIYKWDNSMTVTVSENTANASFKIYPNPAADKLNIEMVNDFSTCTLQIYNSAGMIIKEIEHSGTNEINIKELSDGIYLIKSKDDPKVNIKFIKQG